MFLVPYESRLKQLKLWSLEDRRICADLIEVFKIVSFETYFEYSSSDQTRGHSLKLNKKNKT